MSKLLSRLLLILASSSVLLPSLLQAQTLQAAQNALTELQTEQTGLKAQINRLEADVAAKRSELAAAQSRPSPERDELDAAEKELVTAKAAHATNPNDMNQITLKNAELKHHLAERKYHKSSSAITDLREQLQRSEDQLNAARSSLAANSTKIDEQKRLVSTAASKAAANAEIEKQQALQRKLAAEKEAAEQAVSARQLAQKQAAEAAAAKAQAEKTAAAEAAKKAAEKANGLTRLNDKTAVSNEQARINTLLEGFWQKGKVNQVMYLRKDGSESKGSNTLRDLGHLQYRSELTAPAGKVLLNIGLRKWEITFDQNDAGKPFVFIYDQSNNEKPRLVYYLKSLE
jgi:DNA repair exonuclease SbcCD ATPase subunit